MESNTNPAPAEVLTPVAEPAAPNQPTKTESPEANPSKSSKTLIWCLSILAIIGVAAAAVFAYLYFTAPTTLPASPTSDNQSSTSTESETNEEVAITDPLVKKDLDEKVSIIHYTTAVKPTIEKSALHPEYILYTKGNLSELAKFSFVGHSLEEQFENLPNNMVEAIFKDLGYTKDSNNNIIINDGTESSYIVYDGVRGIKGDIMRDKYLDVFGETIPDYDEIKNIDTLGAYCAYYRYNSTYDYYYIDPISGCGGTGPYDSYYYKNSYTTKGDYAYVYVSAGTFNAEDDKAYCDIISGSEMPEVCDTTSTRDSFTINESNYKDYAEYRLVFKKSDKGTYYFVKAEKV